jgi:hypothetical protein
MDPDNDREEVEICNVHFRITKRSTDRDVYISSSP